MGLASTLGKDFVYLMTDGFGSLAEVTPITGPMSALDL